MNDTIGCLESQCLQILPLKVLLQSSQNILIALPSLLMASYIPQVFRRGDALFTEGNAAAPGEFGLSESAAFS